jgi:hypothetical protein
VTWKYKGKSFSTTLGLSVKQEPASYIRLSAKEPPEKKKWVKYIGPMPEEIYIQLHSYFTSPPNQIYFTKYKLTPTMTVLYIAGSSEGQCSWNVHGTSSSTVSAGFISEQFQRFGAIDNYSAYEDFANYVPMSHEDPQGKKPDDLL